MANKELSNIVQALGCGLGESMDLERLRYHKIILLMDADSDGHHICTLLLTFLYRYMRPLIDAGYVYIAQPPLYRVDAGKETFWALDDGDRVKIEAKLNARKRPPKIELQRFKGLGEMMPKTLYETTLDPEKRHLLQVDIPDTQRLITENVMSDLMGKDASARYRFIMERSESADADDLDV